MIAFRISFAVLDGKADEFEQLIADRYQPGLARQRGFIATRLNRTYDAETVQRIGATTGGVDYVLEFEFESEPDRMAWVEGPDHDELWNAAVALTRTQSSCGYDVLAQQP